MIGIRDKQAALNLLGNLWDERIDAEVYLRADEQSPYAEVRVLPNQSLNTVSKVIADSGFDLSFDGDKIRIYDRIDGLPDETIGAVP
jgi:hypothetical protein